MQVRDELDAALRHLRQVHDSYWDYEWRRDHRGGGRYPEHELWDAVYGYLNLLDAATAGSTAHGGWCHRPVRHALAGRHPQ